MSEPKDATASEVPEGHEGRSSSESGPRRRNSSSASSPTTGESLKKLSASSRDSHKYTSSSVDTSEGLSNVPPTSNHKSSSVSKKSSSGGKLGLSKESTSLEGRESLEPESQQNLVIKDEDSPNELEESEKVVPEEPSIPEANDLKTSRNSSCNSIENGAKLVGVGHTSSKVPTRLGVPLVGPPFESGANTEAIQLLRQLWSVHEEAVGFLKKIRSLLSTLRQESRSHENAFEFSLLGKRTSTTPSVPGSKGSLETPVGKKSEGSSDEWWRTLPGLVEGLTSIHDSFADIETQFLSLVVFQTQCKLSLLAKVRNAKGQVSHDRLSIMHGVQQLITAALQLTSSNSLWGGVDDHSPLSNVFHLTEVYNACVESSWSSFPVEATLAASASPGPPLPPTSGSVTSIPQSGDDAKGGSAGGGSSSGDPSKSPSLPNRLRILVQINAANRNDSALLRLSLKPLSATRLLQLVARKRSTFASHSFSRIALTHLGEVLSGEKFEGCFREEDSGLSSLAKGFSLHPALLGRAAVKKTENGDQRLSRSARGKMVSYFHQVVWTLAGEHAEDLLLWGIQSPHIPLLLQPLQSSLTLTHSLGVHFQQTHLSPMLSAFDAVGGALHSFTLLANWDEKIREAFEETHRVKRPEQVALLRKPSPTEWATGIGEKFGQIVTTCVTLIDGDRSGGRSGDLPPLSDEEHLGDEAQTLFRLEATLIYFKTWIVKRSKVWLNAWAIPQFLAFSQRESALLVKLIKSREPLLITRDFLLNNDNVSIRLIAKHRQSCANDLRTALLQLQTMPDEMLQAVGPVCNTLSLATFQSYMPPAPHWRGVGRNSGLDPDKPSSYIKIFIERVIEPVVTASVELVPGPVQEAMGKQTVHAACDAWLEYILQRKIKFSEWGAVQLLRDFTAVREWIRTETSLEKEARRAILQLEVLRRCEGVAYLLLRNPGDVLGVGKPSRKNRKIAPSSSGSADSSPSAADSTADDDIPPEMYVPNQQMWLELRLRRSMFTSPCCQ